MQMVKEKVIINFIINRIINFVILSKYYIYIKKKKEKEEIGTDINNKRYKLQLHGWTVH